MLALKDRLEIAGHFATVISAIAVVLSVVYLAGQISSNTHAIRAQTYDSLLNQFNQTNLLLVSDPELASIFERGLVDPESLTDEEWSRFLYFNLIAVNVWEYAYYLNRDGLAIPQLWEGGNSYFVEIARTRPGMKRYWDQMRFVYEEPFRSYADQYFFEEIVVTE